jgi:hypothetical protein
MPRRAPRYHALNQSRFYAVGSRARLAKLFALNRKSLDQAIADERAYSKRVMELTRNGKTKRRIIQEPRGVRRQIHAIVCTALSRIEPLDTLFCPVRGRSYVSNAERHAVQIEPQHSPLFHLRPGQAYPGESAVVQKGIIVTVPATPALAEGAGRVRD